MLAGARSHGCVNRPNPQVVQALLSIGRGDRQYVEGPNVELGKERKDRILERLNAAEAFEKFLATKYVGTKRFGIEGAELYLADEHPNGAGLVDWAKSNWEMLLEGCVHGTGNLNRLGRFIREETRRATGDQDWRTPDILLKGFRNRQLHGLIDWRLGLELLSAMHDPSYTPGVSPDSDDWGEGVQGWEAEASALADLYCSAIADTHHPERFSSEDGILQGWFTVERDKRSAYIVSHPLWEFDPQHRDDVSKQIFSLVSADKNAQTIRLLDSFNLSRRMSWVRANLLHCAIARFSISMPRLK